MWLRTPGPLPVRCRPDFSPGTRLCRIAAFASRFCGVVGLFGVATASSLAEPVIWHDLKNATPSYPSAGSGSTLIKTSGLVSWNSAGGSSLNRLEADGSLSFRFGSTLRKMAIGLSYQDKDLSVHSIKFAVVANCDKNLNFAPGTWAIRIDDRPPQGVTTGPFATTDVFSLVRSSDVLSFRRNGTPILNYRNVRPGTLIVDASFYDTAASLEDCDLQSAGTEQNVIWDELDPGIGAGYNARGGDVGSRLTHSPANTGPQSAVSSKAIDGDGYLKFRIGDPHGRGGAGLSEANPYGLPASLQYGIVATSVVYSVNGTANAPGIEEDDYGTLLDNGQTFKFYYYPSDVFRIERTAGHVTFYQNGRLMRTSNVASSGPLVVAAALNTPQASIVDCRLSLFRCFQPGESCLEAWGRWRRQIQDRGRY